MGNNFCSNIDINTQEALLQKVLNNLLYDYFK